MSLPGVGPEEVYVAPAVALAGDGVVVPAVRPDGVQHRHEVPRAAAVPETLLVLQGNPAGVVVVCAVGEVPAGDDLHI